MTIQEIRDSVTEQDAYRREAEIKRRIAEFAVSKLPPVAEGYERTITGVDYATGEASYQDTLTADRVAAEEAAAEKAAAARKQAMIDYLQGNPILLKLMGIYRSIIRRIFSAQFGERCETNRALTREVVAAFFLTQIESGTMTDELRDAHSVLEFAFDTLSPIVGATPPNVWDLPWEVVP